jgi:drug/metabolite transporter (DMT)-like permease
MPHVLLTAMIAIWGGCYPIVKVALESLTPFAIIALRFWLGLLCLLPFLRGDVLSDLRRTRGPGLAAGVVLALGYIMQTAGIRETSASMGGFLAGLIVPLVGLGGFLFFGVALGVRSLFGLALGVAGMAMLCWPVSAATQPDTARGIAMQVVASASYAAHILLLSHWGRGLPALAFCVWQLLVVAIAGTATTLCGGGFAANPDDGVVWTPGLVLAIAYFAFLATALGIAVQSKVQHRIAPMHVALLFALQPLFAALLSWLALGDRMSALQLGGGTAIVGGVVVSAFERKQRRPPTFAEPAGAGDAR